MCVCVCVCVPMCLIVTTLNPTLHLVSNITDKRQVHCISSIDVNNPQTVSPHLPKCTQEVHLHVSISSVSHNSRSISIDRLDASMPLRLQDLQHAFDNINLLPQCCEIRCILRDGNDYKQHDRHDQTMLLTALPAGPGEPA